MKLAKFHFFFPSTPACFFTTDLTPQQLFSLTFEGNITLSQPCNPETLLKWAFHTKSPFHAALFHIRVNWGVCFVFYATAKSSATWNWFRVSLQLALVCCAVANENLRGIKVHLVDICNRRKRRAAVSASQIPLASLNLSRSRNKCAEMM